MAGVNQLHLQLLASPDWAKALETELLPWIESAGDLGDHLLEIGAGPGLTTDLLRSRVARVTAVEIDPSLGEPLAERMAGTNVEVIVADATRAGLPSEAYSSAACFSILHHMPTEADQDRLFVELYRLLQPGGIFVGQESLDVPALRKIHEDDTFTPVDPAGLPRRLIAAGFGSTRTEVAGTHFRFRAQKPA